MKIAVLAFMVALMLPFAAAAGPAPDNDNDGVANIIDGCQETFQTAGVDDCDSDIDGYGNMCDADMNDDGTIDFGADFGVFLGAFTNFSMGSPFDPQADMNCDGTVDFGADFGQFLQGFTEFSAGDFGLNNPNAGEALNSGKSCAGMVGACP